MTFGDEIIAFRYANGYSQRDFAKICGMSNTEISFLERGLVTPTVETAEKISRVIGLKSAELKIERKMKCLRCGDCKHKTEVFGMCFCKKLRRNTTDDGYCWWGEKK